MPWCCRGLSVEYLDNINTKCSALLCLPHRQRAPLSTVTQQQLQPIKIAFFALPQRVNGPKVGCEDPYTRNRGRRLIGPCDVADEISASFLHWRIREQRADNTVQLSRQPPGLGCARWKFRSSEQVMGRMTFVCLICSFLEVFHKEYSKQWLDIHLISLRLFHIHLLWSRPSERKPHYRLPIGSWPIWSPPEHALW